jgi:hypothetical protein
MMRGYAYRPVGERAGEAAKERVLREEKQWQNCQ